MKNKIYWYIDKQIIPVLILNKIKESLQKSDSGLLLFDLSEDSNFPPFPAGKFVPYGSTHLVKHCLNTVLPNCFLFMNDKDFSTKECVNKLGERMLNFDAVYCKLEDVFSLDLPECLFIKPDSDLKSFTGSVVKKEGLERFYNKVKNNEFDFNLSIPIVINTSKNTGWEWRLVMIKDQVIGCSSYKLKNMLNLNKNVPQKVLDFAFETAKIWYPSDIYVIDIGETDNGLKVVEFNCFNASGLYNCDIFNIIQKINNYVLEH